MAKIILTIFCTLTILLLIFCALTILVLIPWQAPVFRSENARFSGNPDVLRRVQPYLDDWATLPEEETASQQRRLEDQLGIMIMVYQWDTTSSGQSVQVVDIVLEVWGDWWRGYLYVSEDIQLYEWGYWKLREIKQGLYVYNRND